MSTQPRPLDDDFGIVKLAILIVVVIAAIMLFFVIHNHHHSDNTLTPGTPINQSGPTNGSAAPQGQPSGNPSTTRGASGTGSSPTLLSPSDNQ